MNWVDYREKLGIGFADNQKLLMCKNRINNLIGRDLSRYYNAECLYKYANMVEEEFPIEIDHFDVMQYSLNSVYKARTLVEFISKFVALANSAKDRIITSDVDNKDIHFYGGSGESKRRLAFWNSIH